MEVQPAHPTGPERARGRQQAAFGTTVKLVPPTELAPPVLQGIAKVDEGIATGEVFKVFLNCKPNVLITEGLFAVHKTGNATIQEMLAKFQAIFFRVETLNLLIQKIRSVQGVRAEAAPLGSLFH